MPSSGLMGHVSVFTPRLSLAITSQAWLRERHCRPGCSGTGLGDKVQAGPRGDMNSPSSAWCRGRVGLEKEKGWQCRTDAEKSSQTRGKASTARHSVVKTAPPACQ
ncbi:unnamed protein product [Rangifer tarandus platyrhynchus]|uniref:Uncharacterized protein n=2 Tax=Rangifer tarandus platyrhynchus TaxID=3082113 RepID=A0ABN8XX01_RANTA|nr:unnamed protein product [Rangifer tarandus platyrhynchus]CAI9690196.1 unnamed protein product [Rangifer tarandus platyrhynchus]